EPPRTLDAPRPAPRPFPEPPAAPAEPQRAAPETRSARTDALAKQSESGIAQAQAERERVTAPQASAPPVAAAVPDTAPGTPAPSQRAKVAKPAQAESAERLEDKAQAGNVAGAGPAWRAYENQPPEKWLERVAELRRGGREADARDMLAE